MVVRFFVLRAFVGRHVVTYLAARVRLNFCDLSALLEHMDLTHVIVSKVVAD